MGHPSKRRCTRIDRALVELDSLVSASGRQERNYDKIYSVLRFIFKEYCQSRDGIDILFKTDFKDYFLIILTFKDIPSNVINILLSLVYNASKDLKFFDDLINSPVYEAVTSNFLNDSSNYYRSLRFLGVSLYYKKGDFKFPLERLPVLMGFCLSNGKAAYDTLTELMKFITAYVKKEITSNWAEYLEENDISPIIETITAFFSSEDCFRMLLKPADIFSLAKVCMGVIKHDNTPLDIGNQFKEILCSVIKWFALDRSTPSIEHLLDMYHPTTICYMCYLSENIRESLFREILLQENTSTTKRVLTIYYNLCQEGSYRTVLVDSSFCQALVTLMNKFVNSSYSDDLNGRRTALQIFDMILSIFFVFNSGEKLIICAMDCGLFAALLSLVGFIYSISQENCLLFRECKGLLPKTFILMYSRTLHLMLEKKHFEYFIGILKVYENINCLNYLLFLSLSVDMDYLASKSFMSLIFHNLDCSLLTFEEQKFEHPPLRSAPSSMKNIASIPLCGKMILSNLMHNLSSSFLTAEKFFPEYLLLLRRESFIRLLLVNRHIYNVLESYFRNNVNNFHVYNSLFTLIKWLLSSESYKDGMIFPNLNDACQSSNNSLGNSDIIIITNGKAFVYVPKYNILNLSPVFYNMFRHGFKEQVTGSINLPYLSTDALNCFITVIISKDVDYLKFSHQSNSSGPSYSWKSAFELLMFALMFDIGHVFQIISLHLIKGFTFTRNEISSHIQSKAVFTEIVNKTAIPLLQLFADRKL